MREYLLVMLIAASATYLLSGLCRKFALAVGAVAQVRERDVHKVPVPYFGGLAMFGGLGAAFLLGKNLPFLGAHQLVSKDVFTVLLSCAIICLIGVIDDWVELSALVKASGQMLASFVAVFNGIRVYWIPLPERVIVLDPLTSALFTVFFVFVCINAINFIDGLDGLAAGVVGIGALAFFAYAYFLAYENDLVRATTASLLSVGLAGVCLGFLPHNYHRAKMFMGDSGSMLLGMAMACVAVTFTGQIDPSSVMDGTSSLLTTLLPVMLPLAVLALPLIDLVQVYLRRTMAGHWWYVADKRHVHHQLLKRGHSQTRAVLLMYCWSAWFGFGTVAIGLMQSWLVVALVLAIGVAILLFTLKAPQVGKSAQRLVKNVQSNDSQEPKLNSALAANEISAGELDE